VSYNLARTNTVTGTAFFSVDNVESQEEVKVDLITEQEGFLVLRLASFPDLRLETLSDKEVVQMYIAGSILGSSRTIVALEDNVPQAPTAASVPSPQAPPPTKDVIPEIESVATIIKSQKILHFLPFLMAVAALLW